MRSANTNNGCDFPYGHELQEEWNSCQDFWKLKIKKNVKGDQRKLSPYPWRENDSIDSGFFFFNPKLGKPEVLQSFSFKVEEKELSTQNSIPSRNQHIYDERKLRGLVYNKPTLKEW
jgi:hypothetical protein